MNKETFHQTYGCFGVRAVMHSKDVYGYNKQHANRTRLKVRSFINTHKPSRAELITWLRNLVGNNRRIMSKQSIQIGIIHALQNNGIAGQEIYGILNTVWGKIAKGQSDQDAELRNNAANYRQNTTV